MRDRQQAYLHGCHTEALYLPLAALAFSLGSMAPDGLKQEKPAAMFRRLLQGH